MTLLALLNRHGKPPKALLPGDYTGKGVVAAVHPPGNVPDRTMRGVPGRTRRARRALLAAARREQLARKRAKAATR